jgi:Pyruvate/2-oxoacid:ferredoxin oxidoreductase delta subunit
LSSIFSGAKQVPKSLINEVIADEPAELEQGIKIVEGTDTSRLRLLKQALKASLKGSLKKKPVAAYENSSEELKQVDLASTCYFCTACSILCPLGAIKQTEDNKLILDTGKCTGCNLCVEVCVHKSLTLVPSNLNQVIRSDKKVIAQGIEDKCQKCGQQMISSEARELCFICDRNAQRQTI